MQEPNPPALPPEEWQQAEAFPPAPLSREAMSSDAAAALSWLDQSPTWTLLDQTVTPLLGRSPQQIASAIFSGVIDLPDAELAVLLGLLLERAADYLGLSDGNPLSVPRPPEPDELDAIAAARAAVSRAVLG